MDSSFSISAIWSQADLVTNLITVFLLGMSVVSWTVIVMKLITINRQRMFSHRIESFWHSPSLDVGMNALGVKKDNAFRQLAEHGAHAVAHISETTEQLQGSGNEHGTSPQLHDQLDLSDWVTRSLRNSVELSVTRLQAGLAFLASIGSTAPFVGLFGTVWGIYHALTKIGTSGQASLDQIAGPIGEALVMTALGLAVAIPAVLGYNALLRASKQISGHLNQFSYDLHAYFVTGARVQGNKSKVQQA